VSQYSPLLLHILRETILIKKFNKKHDVQFAERKREA